MGEELSAVQVAKQRITKSGVYPMHFEMDTDFKNPVPPPSEINVLNPITVWGAGPLRLPCSFSYGAPNTLLLS